MIAVKDFLYENAFILIAIVIFLPNIFKKNNNFLDIRNIFYEQFSLFKNTPFQYLVYYGCPILLAIGITRKKLIEKDLISNINIIISIFLSIQFAMLSIINSFSKKNDANYLRLLDETYNSILFEIIECVVILLISFTMLFVDDFTHNKYLFFLSWLLYTLIFIVILQLLIIIKRMKALFDNR